MRKRHPYKADQETIDEFIKALAVNDHFEQLLLSPHGQFLIECLENNIEETKKIWMAALYTVTDEQIVHTRYAIRSKIDTLNALAGRIRDATVRKNEINEELARIKPE